MATAGLYVHGHLPSHGAIRLVRISPEQNQEALKCSFLTIELTSAPEYTALSYCWGDAPMTVPMHCDDKTLLITPNLSAALSRILAVSNEPVLLWIDQLCINQKDIVERTAQVQIMQHIYRRASRTVVWLGEDEDDQVEVALRLVAQVKTVMDREAVDGNDEFSHEIATNDSNSRRGLPPLLFQERSEKDPAAELTAEEKQKGEWSAAADWIALRWLISRPWFSRIWVIQEMVMSKTVTIMCGPTSIVWGDLALVAVWLDSKGYSQATVPKVPLGNVSFFGMMQYQHQMNPLLELLGATRRFGATDPRDKIFALLALSKDVKTGNSLPQSIQPDYGKSWKQVCIEFVRHSIQTRGLDALSEVQHVTPEMVSEIESRTTRLPVDDFPSWVPRWEAQHYNGCGILGRGVCRPFTAAGRSRAELRNTDDDGLLVLHGIRVDKVRVYSKMVNNTELGLQPCELKTNLILEWWFDVASKNRRYETGALSSQAFYMSTVAGSTNHTQRADQHSFNSFWRYLIEAYEMKLCYRGPPVGEKPSISLQRRTIDYTPLEAARRTDMWYINVTMMHPSGTPSTYAVDNQVCIHRRLFITEKGYYGLGPAGLREGDDVCILFGGSVPFVLRKVGEEYQLLGECYVFGIMEGQAMEDWEDGKLQDEWFNIR